MQNTRIYRKRVRQFIDRVVAQRYGATEPLEATFTYDKSNPIPIEELESRTWKQIRTGTHWGKLWGSAWFRFRGTVPDSMAGHEVVALVDLGSEGCVFRDGAPYQGLTDLPRTGSFGKGKRRIMLFPEARGGEEIDLLVEAAANSLFGYRDHEEFVYRQADLAVFDAELWRLGIDLDFLLQLADALPEHDVRSRRILTGLNDAANVWADGEGRAEVSRICADLLKPRANASATTAWSVGHAHLDLGWLWPVRETRRKAGRTFSTALRMLEEYPDYVFGTSQPQALAWVKEDYPALYEQIRTAVAGGRWECQGGMWVEPDMNLTSGESLVRQLLYGKRFFRSEFGVDVKNLWLPDVFGYSAALPQILKLAGVDVFMTQKISWNESNTFPHHTFDWEGIDGTRIRTHFLPTNTYNAANAPEEMAEAEKRFSQADVSGDWLNLYGIGDGGGGPSRRHIEFALRSQNTEGLPRLKLAPADEFLKRVAKIPADRLPLWRGELYLELHRGTYTTQGRMKYLNRRLELTLRDAEFLSVIAGTDQRDGLAAIWKNTLLNQFHDILPGSSIREVYEDANAESETNLDTLAGLERASLGALHGDEPKAAHSFVVYNTLSWTRDTLVRIPVKDSRRAGAQDSAGRALPVQPVDGGLLVRVEVPSMGYEAITVSESAAASESELKATADSLENPLLRVRLASDGTIASIYDKELGREVLANGANRLMLWEDLPYSWDAWDISHYYRETRPVQAMLVDRTLVESGPLRVVAEQTLGVGASTIRQRIILEADSKLVRVENHVDWKESHKQLRVEARPAIHSLEANYEIQFGTVRRPAHANTSWDAAQFEVAGQRFADYSQADYGLGLVNDGKYGHSIRDGVMDLTLLRSPDDPDPTADIGEHDFVFGYYPHALGWQASDLLERAHELNSPVLVRGVAKAPERARSEYAIVGGSVKLETVKPAEDGDAIILRLYETRGIDQKVVLSSRTKWAAIAEVDLLEENPRKVTGIRGAAGEGYASEVSLGFGPYQIRSFRVTGS